MKLSQTALEVIGRTEKIRSGEWNLLIPDRTRDTLLRHGLAEVREDGRLYVNDKGRAVHQLEGYLPTPAVQKWLESADRGTGKLNPTPIQTANACTRVGFVEYVVDAKALRPLGYYITELGRAIAGLPAGPTAVDAQPRTPKSPPWRGELTSVEILDAPAVEDRIAAQETNSWLDATAEPVEREAVEASVDAQFPAVAALLAGPLEGPSDTENVYGEPRSRGVRNLTDTAAYVEHYGQNPPLPAGVSWELKVPSPEAGITPEVYRHLAGLEPLKRELTEAQRSVAGFVPNAQSPKWMHDDRAGTADAPRSVPQISEEIMKRFAPPELYTTLRGILSGLLDELQRAAVNAYKADHDLSGGHSGADCQAHSCYTELTEAIQESMASPLAGSDPDHWDGDDTEAGILAEYVRTLAKGARHQAARDLRAEAATMYNSSRADYWREAADHIDPFVAFPMPGGHVWQDKDTLRPAPWQLVRLDETDN